ncbi:unnamed protein product [Arctia plantaginis]|uniref:AAA+ ATPase domain-containing protein n=1 Tax=Arctia plantaginis TaxID=874455 RepID=A0A8S1ANI8_ARCPL|nr:unnamed protein product [Arctia plantaginis]
MSDVYIYHFIKCNNAAKLIFDKKNWQRRHRHVLKSKEYYCKLKCSKLLKKKLKKYKLRQDGTEDPDVLDVSRSLVSSLIIKSPTNPNNHLLEEGDLNHLDELRPKNYLFKMVKRKEPSQTGNVKDATIHEKQNEGIQIANEAATGKKHTNAFQLLMDSRNKSIGSNSPGKERSDDQSDNEDVIEKKNIKIKRKVLLEKMAEAKGYQKNKEIEEYHDKIIKKKMEKRAERLKIMILKEAKPTKSNGKITVEKEAESSKLNRKDEAQNTNCNKDKKKLKTFTIVDIFNTMTDPVTVSPEKKCVPKEDKEFLQKLSPSLRKKESMLSYFKKVDKEPECSPVDSDNDNLLKVKLQVKSKKKGRKKKLSLKKEPFEIEDSVKLNDENKDIASNSKALSEVLLKDVENSESKNFSERQKRKRNGKKNISEEIEFNNDSRPKRSIKKPVKYTDDACISSSDDELLIFTPKKKRYVDSSTNSKIRNNNKTQNVLHEHNKKPIIDKKVNEETNTAKKSVKLAPIFATKQLDTAALEAKQKFLQSGVPDKLKKIIQQQKIQSAMSNDFPVVVHVQQRHSDKDELEQVQPNIYEESADVNHDFTLSNIDKEAYKKLLNLQVVSEISCMDHNSKKSIQTILQNIKQIHPKFPVYRTYRYLRGKRKGELKDCNLDFNNSIEIINDEVDIISNSPDKLNWTDKYKAISTNQIIGNFESIKELRKWLVSWSENEIKLNSRRNSNSDSSDYYQSDTDSRDSLKTTNNLLILTGPTGCGKTSSVYTVAAELAIKVIEVNASSKRTGKIMLQDLQEATQSHKVNRGTSNTDSSQKSQEKNLTELLKKNKKKGRPKKSTEKSKKSTEESVTLSATPSSQESVRTAMSLILVDDADIVFDQDDGFTSAIVQLVQSSKRPVILITSSLVCPHLQRFFLNGKILKMSPLLPRPVGTWLDIMCLADTGNSWPGLGANFLNYFRGDIRKTINYLQFYVSSSAYRSISNEETASQDVDYPKTNIDDENSNMSWADHLDSEERKLIPNTSNSNDVGPNSLWTDFVDGHLNLARLRYPIQLFDIWWSLPHLLSTEPTSQDAAMLVTKSERPVRHELDAIANVMDAISLSDCVTHTHPQLKSDTTWPWYTCESDSVSEQDNIDYYRNNYEVTDEISHTLVTGYIAKAQDVLSCDRKTDIQIPGMSLQRERDKIVTRHKHLTSYLSTSSTLDRRSLALDYWSSCRTICRIEKSKTDTQINAKRNNRFCHYLKSLSVLCKSDTFDNLCDSLSYQGTELKISKFNE